MGAREPKTYTEQVQDGRRPLPDEAPLEVATTPEQDGPMPPEGGLRDLSAGDWFAVAKRAVKGTLDHNMTMIAAALAYSSFFAMPAVLLVVVGLFTLIAGPQTINTVIEHLGHVMPSQATQLLQGSLSRLEQKPSTGITMTAVGLVLALWSITGAMTSFMTAVNLAYDRKDSRSFLKKRLVALAMAACMGAAFVLVAVLLIFGPQIEKYLGSALGIQSVLKYVWWSAQWPILVGGLLAAFSTVLWLGPDVERSRWRFLTFGSAVAVAIWLIASAAFALFTARFGSYNKTWGSLSAVIIMLTWLWLSGLALLFGAELDAEAKRSREPRPRRQASPG